MELAGVCTDRTNGLKYSVVVVGVDIECSMRWFIMKKRKTKPGKKSHVDF